ncbi:MAG: D-alanyl-D-alanine carboxypeptidase family protein [Clostridia bacterium]|nr:D-alanyl-D-alanine carboxypeptidase family protein [Clostridia bacterium]
MQQIRHGSGLSVMMCLGILFSLILATGAFYPEQERIAIPILGERDGWAVHRGAKEMRGREIHISRQEMMQGTLLLIGKDHPLPDDYPPPNTRTLRAMVGMYLPVWEDTALLPEAVYSLCDMKQDYSLDSGITFTRGALSAAQLEDWQRQAFQRFSRVYPLQDALHLALLAVPGGMESEHRTGYALDLELHPPLSLGKADPLLRNDVGRWLSENMWRYGWIYRYGPDHEGGGDCEGIHIRYAGKGHAAAMHALQMGLEEYWALLRQEGELTLYQNGIERARIYCTPCQDDWEILLPDEYEYAASLDNTGWAAVIMYPKGTI